MVLECIGSKACIWLGDKGRKLNGQGINWLTSRNVKIRQIKCEKIFGYNEEENDDMAVEISSSSDHLQWLTITDDSRLLTCVRDVSIIRIVERCSNIQSLN